MEENKIMSPQIKGLLIALIIIILGIAGYFTGLGFSTWFNWVVNAIMFAEIFEMQQAQMEKSGLDDDKLEQAMTMMKKYFMIFLVLGVIFGTLIWGSIASLIGAAVAKKKKFNPLDQMPG